MIKSVGQDQNTYLKGHEGRVILLTCSKDGRMFASGEILGPGFMAAVIVWDFESKEMMYRVRVHKEAIQALSFNCDSKFLVSMGGLVDTNNVICWDL